MKVISLQPLSDRLTQQVAEQTEFVSLANQDFTAADLTSADIILGWSPKIVELLAMPNQLKWLQIWFAGVDNLPLDKLAAADIYLTSASGANAPAIAQQTMGYMISFVRQLHQSARHQATHTWQVPHDLTELTNKRLVTLGTGEIAQNVAKLAHAFAMEIVGVNHNGHASAGFDHVLSLADVNQALTSADFVVNTLPATPATNGLVNQQFFAAMQDTAYYLSVGRGKTTVTADLIHALNQQTIAGAALDVVDPEPLPANSPLWQFDNVILTSHTAGHTDYYDQRIIAKFLENLADFKQGLAPQQNLINYKRGY